MFSFSCVDWSIFDFDGDDNLDKVDKVYKLGLGYLFSSVESSAADRRAAHGCVPILVMVLECPRMAQDAQVV